MYGQGGIYKRGRVWWMRFWVNGKVIRRSCKTESRQSALISLAEALRDVGKGDLGSNPYLCKMDALLRAVERDYSRRGLETQEECKRTIKVLVRAIGHLRPGQVTQAGVCRLVDGWQELGLANATINRRLAKLRRALRLHSLPCPPFPQLREDNARVGFLSPDQLALAVSHIRHADTRDAVEWFGWTGMRPKEIRQLVWEWYDAHDRCIYIGGRACKNKQSRILPITGPLGTIFARRLLCEKGPYIFHRDGRKLGRFHKAWYSALKRAGLPRFLPYDVRRSAVRNLRRAGVPEEVAMKISGHKTREVFRRYNITDVADMQQAIQRVARFSTTPVPPYTPPALDSTPVCLIVTKTEDSNGTSGNHQCREDQQNRVEGTVH